MKYNFDEVINRKNTYSTQWDYIQDRFGVSDILPFSISDTDFKAPLEVIDTCKEILNHGVFGYSRWNHDDFKYAITNYYDRRHQTKIDKDTIVYSPSVLYTISQCIKLCTNENDGICVFEPMYDAFYHVIQDNNRKLNTIQLIVENNDYIFNEKEVEEQASKSKMFLLCSPHNPTGKVWKDNELKFIVEICKKYNIPLVSDEIHCDVIRNSKHIPIFKYLELYDNLTIVSSASKTFNIPSLGGSYAMFARKELREKFLFITKNIDFVNSPSIMGMRATMTAYNQCDDYIDELNEYINCNLDIVEKFVAMHKGLRFIRPEATYLAWISFEDLNISDEFMQKALVDIGKVGIMNGKVYGNSNYLRMNCGCSKEKLNEGLKCFDKALKYIEENK